MGNISLKGFEAAKPLQKNRQVLSINGRQKAGKSWFALNAQGPVAYMNFDEGLEGVIDKVLVQSPDKQILVSDYQVTSKESVDKVDYEKLWAKFKADFYTALESDQICTVVTDTGSEMYELARLAKFGKLTQVQPFMYGVVNAELREMVRKSFGTDKNVIFLHKVKSEYLNDKATGNYIPSGFGDMQYLVQTVVTLGREKDKEQKGVEHFTMQIDDCRPKPELNGLKLQDEAVSFQTLMTLLFPETDMEYWA